MIQYIKKLKEKGFTLKKISKETGIEYTTICKYAKTTRLPNYNNFIKIIELYNESIKK